MSAIVEKAQEIKDAVAAMDPESILEGLALVEAWVIALATVGEALTAFGEKVAEWPIDATVKDHVRGVAPVQALAAEQMGEAPTSFRIIHATELANLERARQEMWDKERNRL